MPKQILKIEQFYGGLNSNSDPRDIAENELSDATDIMVDELGRIRLMGGTSTAHENFNGNMTAGYGLFQFSSDYKGGDGNVADGEAETDYIAYYDHTNSEVDIFESGEGSARAGLIDLGTSANGKPSFYCVDGALRVSDGAFGDDNVNQWYGYIGYNLFVNASTTFPIASWTNTPQKISAPTSTTKFYTGGASDATLEKTSTTDYDATDTINDTDGYLFNNAIGGNDADTGTTFDPTSDSDIGQYITKLTLNIKAVSFGGYFTSTYILRVGKHDGSNAFAEASFKKKNGTLHYNTYGSYGTVDASEDTIVFNWGGSGLDLGTGSDDQLRISLRWLTNIDAVPTDLRIDSLVIESTDTAGATNWSSPSNSLGVTIGQSSESLDSSLWGEDFNVAATFIYDGSQESLPTVLTNDSGVTKMAITANKLPYLNVSVKYDADWNYRITGANIYVKKITDSDWKSFADIDFIKDSISVRGDDNYNESHYDADNSGWVYSLAGSKFSLFPTVEGYQSSTGIQQDEISIISKYKTSVVANRVAYIGNIKVEYEDETEEVLGDAMLKSSVNNFDLFPLSRRIEASIRDGDNIVKLEEYADRILQFKKRKMHLINISQEIEFLEDTFMHKGVLHPAATCKTDFGIAWVNKLGCYLYNGQNVVNLLEKGGVQIIKESDWESFITDNSIIGYLPKKRQLIVLKDCSGSSDGDIYLYDLVTKSWIKGDTKFTDDVSQTNFITDWNGDLLHAHTSGTILKWDDASDSSSNVIMITKDIDFGNPGVRKKIYKVYLTYKGNATRAEVHYGVDGLDPALTFFTINSDGSTTGGSSTAKCLVNAGTTDWLKAELKPGVSINNISSLRFKISGDGTNAISSDFEINDISIVYRLKSVK